MKRSLVLPVSITALLASALAILPSVAPADAAPPPTASTRHLLALLPVRTESHAASYRRSDFRLWIDADHDGRNTRAEVLSAESSTPVTLSTRGVVTAGRWRSAYDGRTFTTGSKLDIDHLVPLEEAWTSGAWKWSATRREAYANDLGYAGSLIAVSAHANRSKGDRDPSEWLPSDAAYRCTYVRTWIAVKSRWHLAVDPAEKAALVRDLTSDCTSVRVRRPGTPSIAVLVGTRTASTASTAAASSSKVALVSPAPRATALPPAVLAAPAAAPLGTVGSVPVLTAPIAAAPVTVATSAVPDPMSSAAASLSPTATSGATAVCRDGTLSYSATHSGTCSHHGGVAQWL